MISIEGVEWAINAKQEILCCHEFLEVSGAPTAFIIGGNIGYIVFEKYFVAKVDLPEEILASCVPGTNILIVSLRGGQITTETLVPISSI